MSETEEDTSMFPRVGNKKRGYDVSEVDEFLAIARQSFNSSGTPEITSAQVRAKAFSYVKNGYETRFVDAALERLEDVFAARETRSIVENDELQVSSVTIEQTKQLIQLKAELQDRGMRPNGQRFRKTSVLAFGYKRSQVDIFLDGVVDVLSGAMVMLPGDAREVTFTAERGGYDEAQVDAYLDALVEYLISQTP